MTKQKIPGLEYLWVNSVRNVEFSGETGCYLFFSLEMLQLLYSLLILSNSNRMLATIFQGTDSNVIPRQLPHSDKSPFF